MKKICIKMIIVALIICIALCNYSLAADTCKLELVPSAASYKAGDEVKVTLKISNINAGTGFSIMDGVLDYNTSIFDSFTVAGTTAWSSATNDDTYIQVASANLEDRTDNADVLVVTLKLNASAANGTYDVKLKDVSFVGGGNYHADEVVGKVVVNNGTTPANNTVANNTVVNNTVVNNTVANNTVANNTVNNTVVNNTVNNTVVNNTVNNTVVNNTVNNTPANTTNNAVNDNIANGILPYAGLNKPFMAVGIVVVMFAGLTALYKFKKYKSLK